MSSDNKIFIRKASGEYNTTQSSDHWLSVKFENFKPVNYEIKKTATFGRLQGKSSH